LFALDYVRDRAGSDVKRNSTSQIIVADNDPAIRQMVSGYFEEQGMPVNAASSRRELYLHFVRGDPSLIILDLHFGSGSGLELLRQIRSCSNIAVIITTRCQTDELDRIVCLELGADHYIAKPFSVRELLARVRAVLRRQEVGRAARSRNSERGGYRFDGWQLERRGRKLFDPQGTLVTLSKLEYALLHAFLEAPQRPLTREHLLQATRRYEDIFDRSVDVQVCRLRHKLNLNPRSLIHTERGVGYVFAMSVESY
jgi:two-component system OmpR family response regulator